MLPNDCFFGLEGDWLSIRCPSEIKGVDTTKLFLLIEKIRVQRLQSIDSEGAEMELGFYLGSLGNEALPRFRKYWEITYGFDSWQSNPWVWNIEFSLLYA